MTNPFKKMRLARRLLCLSIAGALPVGGLLFFMVKGGNDNRYFAREEIHAGELRPLLALRQQLPPLQARLATTLALGTDLLTRTNAKITTADRTALSVAAQLAASDLSHARGSVETAFNAATHFPGARSTLQKNLAPELAALGTTTETFIALSRKIAAGETIPADAYLAAGFAARAKTQLLWTTSAAELDALLNKRSGGSRQQRLAQISFAILALGLTLGLVFFIMRSIMDPLHALQAALADQVAKINESVAVLARASHPLSVNTDQTVAALETTSASLEEMTAMTKRTAAAGLGAKNLPPTLAELISEIAVANNEQALGMAQINTAVGMIGQVAQGAVGNASQIAAATEILRAQTLALNASIAELRQLLGEGSGKLVTVPETSGISPAPKTFTPMAARLKKSPGQSAATTPDNALETNSDRRIRDGDFKDF